MACGFSNSPTEINCLIDDHWKPKQGAPDTGLRNTSAARKG
jgi:hypothetical protein